MPFRPQSRKWGTRGGKHKEWWKAYYRGDVDTGEKGKGGAYGKGKGGADGKGDAGCADGKGGAGGKGCAGGKYDKGDAGYVDGKGGAGGKGDNNDRGKH